MRSLGFPTCAAVRSLACRFLAALGLLAATVPAAQGDVVVIANRTSRVVKFGVAVGNTKPFARQVDSGDLTTITCRPGELVRAAYLVDGEKRGYTLTPNSVYFFHNLPNSTEFDLREIEMLNRPAAPAPLVEPSAPPVAAVSDAGAAAAKPNDPKSAAAKPEAAPPQYAKVKVKILVDEDEPAVRELWEARLRKRIAAASKILENYAGVTLEVVACDTWITDNQVTEFTESLAEFERRAIVAPADVAIGFSSQYPLIKGRTHLGGTRGALASHILIREASRQISEPERLEVLVHELGHRCGAVHSPEFNSVMRPMLGDRKSVAKGFRILFDPLNTLAIRLLGEEQRDHKIRRLEEVSASTRQNLVAVYSTLAKAFPDDPAAAAYLARLGEAPAPVRPVRKGGAASPVDSARVVRNAVVELAERNLRLPPAATAAGREARLEGDQLTEAYVRAAANAALSLPEDHQVKAFGMGLAVALSDTDEWATNSITRDLLPLVEDSNERAHRKKVIGTPTMWDRHDLARHFFLCESIASVSSPSVAESAGLLKELQDAQGKSGFSFPDLVADLAGIAFIAHLQAAPAERLRDVAQSFTVKAYVPSVSELSEGMQVKDFREKYGSLADPRFKAELEKIRTRVKELPAYKTPAKAPPKPAPTKAEPAKADPPATKPPRP